MSENKFPQKTRPDNVLIESFRDGKSAWQGAHLISDKGVFQLPALKEMFIGLGFGDGAGGGPCDGIAF